MKSRLTRSPEPIAAVAAAPAPCSPAPTPIGLPRVEVNLNLLAEAGPAVALGAGGVGLYRSEFLFLARRTLPTEDEQVGIYRKLLRRLGRPARHDPHLRPAARQGGGVWPIWFRGGEVL